MKPSEEVDKGILDKALQACVTLASRYDDSGDCPWIDCRRPWPDHAEGCPIPAAVEVRAAVEA
jgi:hypothetical protein